MRAGKNEMRPVMAERWQAVLRRDAAFDGRFVYAVRSTGIYCRPSCGSRKPRRENVYFFPLPEVAEQAGYQPCKRCQPDVAGSPDGQVEQVRAICRYIEANLADSLTLQRLGEQFYLSPSHLQRVFKQMVGISPQAYLEVCRMKTIRAALQEGDAISDALYQAGWGSPSRLYSRADSHLGMTPRTYQRGGREMTITYTTVLSPLGHLLVAATERGICAVQMGDSTAELEEGLRAEFSEATIERDDTILREWVDAILQHLRGDLPHLDLPLDVQATAFQQRVWQALLEIPYGETRTYSDIARAIGDPGATRAVARACATNPAAIVIPCHRVTGKDGSMRGYRWGVERKQRLLEQEGM
ncbi:MAG: bifunctional DNA-binding transcriptional regulator/O6-methylguanine-DNA methyltransferase Ada [Ardenticatenaceae bacterium]